MPYTIKKLGLPPPPPPPKRESVPPPPSPTPSFTPSEFDMRLSLSDPQHQRQLEHAKRAQDRKFDSDEALTRPGWGGSMRRLVEAMPLMALSLGSTALDIPGQIAQRIVKQGSELTGVKGSIPKKTVYTHSLLAEPSEGSLFKPELKRGLLKDVVLPWMTFAKGEGWDKDPVKTKAFAKWLYDNGAMTEESYNQIKDFRTFEKYLKEDPVFVLLDASILLHPIVHLPTKIAGAGGEALRGASKFAKTPKAKATLELAAESATKWASKERASYYGIPREWSPNVAIRGVQWGLTKLREKIPAFETVMGKAEKALGLNPLQKYIDYFIYSADPQVEAALRPVAEPLSKAFAKVPRKEWKTFWETLEGTNVDPKTGKIFAKPYDVKVSPQTAEALRVYTQEFLPEFVRWHEEMGIPIGETMASWTARARTQFIEAGGTPEQWAKLNKEQVVMARKAAKDDFMKGDTPDAPPELKPKPPVEPGPTEPLPVAAKVGALPEVVRRIEEPGVATSFDKPQGLYTTPSEFKSPHADLGGKASEYTVNKNAKVLHVDASELYDAGRGTAGQSAGIAALRKFIGDDEVSRLARMEKGDLIKHVKEKYPDVDWGKYFDNQEVLEGYAGKLARDKGYDAIYAIDKNMPEFSEYVALNKKALAPEPLAAAEAAKPAVEATYKVGDKVTVPEAPHLGVLEITRDPYTGMGMESPKLKGLIDVKNAKGKSLQIGSKAMRPAEAAKPPVATVEPTVVTEALAKGEPLPRRAIGKIVEDVGSDDLQAIADHYSGKYNLPKMKVVEDPYLNLSWAKAEEGSGRWTRAKVVFAEDGIQIRIHKQKFEDHWPPTQSKARQISDLRHEIQHVIEHEAGYEVPKRLRTGSKPGHFKEPYQELTDISPFTELGKLMRENDQKGFMKLFPRNTKAQAEALKVMWKVDDTHWFPWLYKGKRGIGSGFWRDQTGMPHKAGKLGHQMFRTGKGVDARIKDPRIVGGLLVKRLQYYAKDEMVLKKVMEYAMKDEKGGLIKLKPGDPIPDGYHAFFPDGRLKIYKTQIDLLESLSNELSKGAGERDVILEAVKNLFQKGGPVKEMVGAKSNDFYVIPDWIAKRFEGHLSPMKMPVWFRSWRNMWVDGTLAGLFTGRWQINNILGNTLMSILDDSVWKIPEAQRWLKSQEIMDIIPEVKGGGMLKGIVGKGTPALLYDDSTIWGKLSKGRKQSTEFFYDLNAKVDDSVRMAGYIKRIEGPLKKLMDAKGYKHKGSLFMDGVQNIPTDELAQLMKELFADSPKLRESLGMDLSRNIYNFALKTPTEKWLSAYSHPFISWWKFVNSWAMQMTANNPAKVGVMRMLGKIGTDINKEVWENNGFNWDELPDEHKYYIPVGQPDEEGKMRVLVVRGANPFWDLFDASQVITGISPIGQFGAKALGGIELYRQRKVTGTQATAFSEQVPAPYADEASREFVAAIPWWLFTGVVPYGNIGEYVFQQTHPYGQEATSTPWRILPLEDAAGKLRYENDKSIYSRLGKLFGLNLQELDKLEIAKTRKRLIDQYAEIWKKKKRKEIREVNKR